MSIVDTPKTFTDPRVADFLLVRPIRSSTFTAITIGFTMIAAALGSPEDRAVVTYYDRNGDGVADYELHQVPGCTYCSYELIDWKCTGRHDEKVALAYPYRTEHVDIRVPRHVKLIRGMPPYIADQRMMPAR